MKKNYALNAIALLIIVLIALVITAARADVGTANSWVYVRDVETGDVVGSLKNGDTVTVVGKSSGWSIVEISGKKYRVWSEYLDISSEGADDVEVINEYRKSKSGGKREVDSNGVIKGSVKEKKIRKGSDFEDVFFW